MRKRILAVTVAVAFALSACATLPEIENPKDVAMASKIAAEAAYSTAYLGYRADRLSDEDMATADRVYNLYFIAQTVLVQSITMNGVDTPESVKHLMPRTKAAIRIDLDVVTGGDE